MSRSLLDATSRKLTSLSEGLQRRDQKFFSKCTEAQVAGNKTLAIIYANECAELRKLVRIVRSSELSLEQASLRLQTVEKLGDVFVTLKPIVEIVEQTKGKLINTIPSVATQLGQVNSLLTSSISEIGSVHEFKDSSKLSVGATKILDEANLSAEDEIRSRFPKLPSTFEKSENVNLKIPVILTATGGAQELESSNSLTQQVYEYVKICEGQFTVNNCADFLGISPKDVERIVFKLKKEGRLS